MLNDTLAAALSSILNAEIAKKPECYVKPASKIVKAVLNIMNSHYYIGDFEEIKDGRGNIIRINLLGKINRCGVIKPRYAVKNNEFEKFEKRYLPAKNFGILIVSTTEGLMTHVEAKKRGIGGRLIAYCY